jgi:hypothetical protein
MSSLSLFALAALVALSLPGTVHAQAPEFTFENGFGGYSQGDGSLKILLGKRRSLHVESRGYALGDSAFRLDQTIAIEGRNPYARTWTVRQNGPNHYTGTLSDASGRVVAQTEGSRLTLRYRLSGPLFMHQTLDLRADGRTIDNRGRITLLGIPIGWLSETIVRTTAPGADADR